MRFNRALTEYAKDVAKFGVSCDLVKALTCVVLGVALVGCKEAKRDENGAYIAGKEDVYAFEWTVVEVNADGNTHQYLVWWPGVQRAGITHLPDCKYCKGKDK